MKIRNQLILIIAIILTIGINMCSSDSSDENN